MRIDRLADIVGMGGLFATTPCRATNANPTVPTAPVLTGMDYNRDNVLLHVRSTRACGGPTVSHEIISSREKNSTAASGFVHRVFPN